MIKDLLRKTGKPLSELILQTTMELGKCYSRLELASSKLEKRDTELFDACSHYFKKGSRARAAIYANEIAEVRKVLSVLQNTQLAIERAILRLDTLKAVSPTMDSLKDVFVDVKKALGLVINVMPSITPEMDRLNSTISEILADTQLDLTMPEPAVIKDSATEAILQEAAGYVKQELERKIPEPPGEVPIKKPVEPLIALAADGSEVYVGKDSSLSLLSEDLIMDYIERNNLKMNVSRCAEELNVPPAKVTEVIESLCKKGKIKIE